MHAVPRAPLWFAVTLAAALVAGEAARADELVDHWTGSSVPSSLLYYVPGRGEPPAFAPSPGPDVKAATRHAEAEIAEEAELAPAASEEEAATAGEAADEEPAAAEGASSAAEGASSEATVLAQDSETDPQRTNAWLEEGAEPLQEDDLVSLHEEDLREKSRAERAQLKRSFSLFNDALAAAE